MNKSVTTFSTAWPTEEEHYDWYVYMVRCADASLYTGIAKDPVARLAQHNDGIGAKYTRTRRPVELVHIESAADHGSALRREYQIKQMSAAQKRALAHQAAIR